MERHVILAHELGISYIFGPFVGAPPALPIGLCQIVCFGPFASAGDIFDRGVEPDVKHFAFHTWPFLVTVLDRDAPIQIAGDATVAQTVAIMQPFAGDGCRQNRPVGFGVDPSV